MASPVECSGEKRSQPFGKLTLSLTFYTEETSPVVKIPKGRERVLSRVGAVSITPWKYAVVVGGLTGGGGAGRGQSAHYAI